MASYNSATIIGNVGGDVVTRTAAGKTLASFSVAVSEKRGAKEETVWFRVTAWEKLGELCAKYLAKGKQVQVVGRVSLNEYQAKDGTAKASLELNARDVTFLGSGDGVSRASSPPASSDRVQSPPVDDDDSIPF